MSPGDAPRPKNLSARVARLGLRALGGWAYEGPLPKPKRGVMLAVPHTSNLDGLLLVLLSASVGLSIEWMIKDDWTKPPLGFLVKAAGAVPVDRSAHRGMVEQMIGEFERRDSFYLVIPPEGTRSRADYWKSGFYRIAVGAKVPLIPGFLDYRRKRGGFGEPIELSGDLRADMEQLRQFYAEGPSMARYPEKFGPVRLRDEGDGG